MTRAGAGRTGRGPRLRCVAGTLCGQPADGPRRACPSAHAVCFQVQSGFHTRGDFRACNSECTCVRAHSLYRVKARPRAPGDRRSGVRAPQCVREVAAGFLGIPATGEPSPETCASCAGPGGWVGLLVGRKKQVLAAGGPVARAVGSESPQTRRSECCSCRPSHTPHAVREPQSRPGLSGVGLGQPLCFNISSQHVMRAVCKLSFRTKSELPGAKGVAAGEAAGFPLPSAIPVLPSTHSQGNLPLAVPRPAGRDDDRPHQARGVRHWMAVPPGKTEQTRPIRPTASQGSRAFRPPDSCTWGSVCGLGASGGPRPPSDAREALQKDTGNHPPG